MSPQTNTQRLHHLMDAYEITPREVAELTNRSYKTVLQWRATQDQPISDHMLELLELKLLRLKGPRP